MGRQTRNAVIASPQVTSINVLAPSLGLAGQAGRGSRVPAYATPPAAASRTPASAILAGPAKLTHVPAWVTAACTCSEVTVMASSFRLLCASKLACFELQSQ